MTTAQRSGCFGLLLKLIGIRHNEATKQSRLPYRRRDDFLSPAELSFYRILERAAASDFKTLAKVRIADLLFVPRQENFHAYQNKINRKHADFVLCDPATMKPQLVIELDDASHQRPDRRERDRFVDDAFAAAGLPILHVKVQGSYSVANLAQKIELAVSQNTIARSSPLSGQDGPPDCPKCNTAMTQRTAKRGRHAGKRFWACTNYPNCREIISIE